LTFTGTVATLHVLTTRNVWSVFLLHWHTVQIFNPWSVRKREDDEIIAPRPSVVKCQVSRGCCAILYINIVLRTTCQFSLQRLNVTWQLNFLDSEFYKHPKNIKEFNSCLTENTHRFHY
jgi:hypothetical protein